ncbi:MAG: flagellar hook-associated protein FlgK [Hydrogenophilus thermoluteolus]
MGMLQIGLTGLMAARYQLDTASHNIANANTEGYSRQRVNQSTQFPQFVGFGYIGRGALLVGVERAYDQFLQGNLLAATTRYAQAQHYQELIAPLDNLVADPDAGLSPALQQFFDAVQEVADNPESIAARQSLLSQGEVLTARFRLFDARIDEIRQDVEQRLDGVAQQVTALARNIADLNQQILQASSRGAEAPPNDLLDQRDQLAKELAGLIGIKTVIDDQGMMSVFIGSGQTLVQGVASATLATEPDPADPLHRRLIYRFGNVGVPQTLPERLVSGGELGALLAFRREGLDRIQDQLGFLATTLALAFNAQHQQGYGLDGVTNRDFFGGVPSTQTFTGDQGSNLTVGWATPLDVAAMQPASFEIRYDGSNYTITRLHDGQSLYTGATLPATFQGLTLTGTLNAGERVVVRPFPAQGGTLAVALTDPRAVAAAQADPTSATGSGPADNVNMLALSSLQTTKTLYADASGIPTATFQTAWASAVAELGTLARSVKTEATASKALVDQVQATRDSYAGVNLDEEAANLIQFQQAYQAASKTMQIAQKLFDEVLAIAQ